MNEHITISEAVAAIRERINSHGLINKSIYERVFRKLGSFSQTWEGLTEQDLIFAFYEALTGVKAFIRPVTSKGPMIQQAGIVINIFRLTQGQNYVKKPSFFDIEATFSVWFKPLLDEYEDWQQKRGKSSNTISTRIGRIKVMFFYFEGRCIQDLKNASIDDFVEFPGYLKDRGYTSQGVHNILYTVRDYLKMPGVLEKMSCNPNPIFTRMHTNKHERLPSFYSADEIRRVLDAIDRETRLGRQIYAVVLLAAVYGMRCSDIKNLRFENFNWDENKISFVQYKTKKSIELPLLSEVRFAVLDYIKNARPKSNYPFIFVTSKAPHMPFSGNNHMAYLLREVFIKAGIDTTGKHCGLHSLRHSLATNLTELSVPLNETTTILGHSNMNTTLTYVWSDLTHLRLAAEEVPTYAKTLL